MEPKKGQSGEDIRTAFGLLDRFEALESFYRMYKDGKYYRAFITEFADGYHRGLIK